VLITWGSNRNQAEKGRKWNKTIQLTERIHFRRISVLMRVRPLIWLLEGKADVLGD